MSASTTCATPSPHIDDGALASRCGEVIADDSGIEHIDDAGRQLRRRRRGGRGGSGLNPEAAARSAAQRQDRFRPGFAHQPDATREGKHRGARDHGASRKGGDLARGPEGAAPGISAAETEEPTDGAADPAKEAAATRARCTAAGQGPEKRILDRLEGGIDQPVGEVLRDA